MAPSEGGTLNPTDLARFCTILVARFTLQPPAKPTSKSCLIVPMKLPHILVTKDNCALFVNLLRNGVEAMPSGGTLRSMLSSQVTTVWCGGLMTRPGIDARVRGKIFEPFSPPRLGTGLGLPICKEIADFHRARLSLGPGWHKLVQSRESSFLW